MPSATPPSGVIIVRVWREAGTAGIRARVIEKPDVAGEEEITRASTDPDEITAWVRAFIARLGVTPP